MHEWQLEDYCLAKLANQKYQKGKDRAIHQTAVQPAHDASSFQQDHSI